MQHMFPASLAVAWIHFNHWSDFHIARETTAASVRLRLPGMVAVVHIHLPHVPRSACACISAYPYGNVVATIQHMFLASVAVAWIRFNPWSDFHVAKETTAVSVRLSLVCNGCVVTFTTVSVIHCWTYVRKQCLARVIAHMEFSIHNIRRGGVVFGLDMYYERV